MRALSDKVLLYYVTRHTVPWCSFGLYGGHTGNAFERENIFFWDSKKACLLASKKVKYEVPPCDVADGKEKKAHICSKITGSGPIRYKASIPQKSITISTIRRHYACSYKLRDLSGIIKHWSIDLSDTVSKPILTDLRNVYHRSDPTMATTDTIINRYPLEESRIYLFLQNLAGMSAEALELPRFL
jgi:hypothetical protein